MAFALTISNRQFKEYLKQRQATGNMGSGCSAHAKVVAGNEPETVVTQGKEVVTPGAVVETPGAPEVKATPGEAVEKVDHANLQKTEAEKPKAEVAAPAATKGPAKKLGALNTMSPINDSHNGFVNTPPNALVDGKSKTTTPGTSPLDTILMRFC